MSAQPTVMSVGELRKRLDAGDAPLLVDVRLEQDFAAGHLPGAKGNCVFEVAFLERMKEIAPDLNDAVCVYGAGPDSHESRAAADKLFRAGYENVLEFREGMEGWKAEAGKLENHTPASDEPQIPDGLRAIDLSESRVLWTGRNLLNKHDGSIALKSGHLSFRDGALEGGEFVLDMRAITCADLTGNALHDVLIRHLHDYDFFDVALYPEARFVITEAGPIAGSGHGAPNLAVRGELTLKDITHPVEFEAVAGLTPEGKPAAQAVFSIDRTKWNVLYGSGKFFHNLAGHMVNDLIDLQIRIVA